MFLYVASLCALATLLSSASSAHVAPPFVVINCETDLLGIPTDWITIPNVAGYGPNGPIYYDPPTLTLPMTGDVEVGASVTPSSNHRVFLATSGGTVGGAGTVTCDALIGYEIRTSDSGFTLYTVHDNVSHHNPMKSISVSFNRQPGQSQLALSDTSKLDAYSPPEGYSKPGAGSRIGIFAYATTTGTFSRSIPTTIGSTSNFATTRRQAIWKKP